MTSKLTLTYYSDVLCIWAHIAQKRVDEVAEQFPNEVNIDYRFCSVFGDTAHKISTAWGSRGGYAGFSKHLHEVAGQYEFITLHTDIWKKNPPASSMPAHLVLKAVQQIDEQLCCPLLKTLRVDFFEHGLDISSWKVLAAALHKLDISEQQVREVIDCGSAYAALEADRRDQQSLMVQGSPTFILNEGRQKLYGNVGYGIIEANIKELLHSPMAGSASWC